MNTNNPTVVDGYTYDKLGLALVISPLIKGETLSASVVMKLTPMRVGDDGVLVSLTEPEYQKTLVVSDAYAYNDPDFQTALDKVHDAVQEYIYAKNL
jgi:hypothetical protein